MLQLYDRYFDYKLFELFRDKLLPTVNQFRQERENSDDVYKHMFLAPESVAKRQSFVITGVATPFVCLYPTSYFNWTDKWTYSRSVLSRKFTYNFEGKTYVTEGYLYDMKKTYRLVASGYFQEFTQRVSQDLIDFDRLRYPTLSLDEMYPDLKITAQLEMKNPSLETKVDETGAQRSFTLTTDYELSVTFPVLKTPRFISRIEVYLNDNLIYQSNVR